MNTQLVPTCQLPDRSDFDTWDDYFDEIERRPQPLTRREVAAAWRRFNAKRTRKEASR